MARCDMKDRQEEAAVERAPFTEFSITDIIFGRCVSIHWLLISSVPATSMREVSSERRKNFYPGNTSGIYQHRRGTADFFSDRLVYSIPVDLRRGDSLRVAILRFRRSPKTKSGLMMRLTILSARDISFLKEVPLEGSAIASFTLYILEGCFLSQRFNSLAFDRLEANYINIIYYTRLITII